MSYMSGRQLEFDFGVTPEQACIMCHLCTDCPNCCAKCTTRGKNGTCVGQSCSRPFVALDGQRWRTWLYMVANVEPHLKRYIPKKYHKELQSYKTSDENN